MKVMTNRREMTNYNYSTKIPYISLYSYDDDPRKERIAIIKKQKRERNIKITMAILTRLQKRAK